MKKEDTKVINLGCRLNFFESEVIKNILNQENLEKKIVINTCAVTNQAVRKSINEVKKASRKFPNYQIYVTGCASQVNEKVFSDLKNVHKIVDNKRKTLPESYTDQEIKEEKDFNFPFLKDFSSSRTRAMLQIQQGCDHRCTFCIIPYGRGDSKSLPFDQINKRAERLIESGYSEIVMTGVDLTSYGIDLPGKPKLGNILRRLLNFQPKLRRLRLSSIDPAEIDDDLMDLLLKEKRILPHLHLSLQSGDNLILKRMKRRHNREEVIKLCHDLRLVRSDFTFGADIIVGFPTETNQMFKNTLELIETCEFTNVHIFPYSPKDGTPASKMPQIKEEEKKLRVEILRNKCKDILHQKLNKEIGKSSSILFESHKMSYSDGYFKVKTKESKNSIKPGSMANVKIVSRQGDSLIAELK
ncbi:MAG: tRNA (N(6)-L-threonylcarbamoyladenosine(37)-C(2))-methylthiotransferase MtaB [Alphaproteobacteria bacterium]|nr:MAG: tRNA (N(6)-L-threonylcarbamoyladenosine(37)-C(2))-methylthiotransferase MtaB [Alphaproteobacteria bacterium]|tara:strand:- start:836 stop:2074 length:1239 start_codon:yes stop_codon:yes gene_type:complete